MTKLVRVLVTFTLLAGTLCAVQAHAACISGGQVANPADCIAADKGATDCLLAWSVDFDGNGNPPTNPNNGLPTSKIVCTDGAPCDRDGHVNGKCTFHVGACVNAGATCSAASLVNATLKKPSEKDIAKKSVKDPQAVYTRRALLGGIDSILGGTEACTASDLEVIVPLKSKAGVCNSPIGQTCTSDQDCDDYCNPTYKKGKAVVLASVDDGGAAVDKDALKFFCEPAPPGPGQCSEVFQVADSADLIGGALAQGRVGDWMLRNGDVRVLVRDVGRAHSFMRTFGGHILDADLVRKNPSEDRDSFNGIQNLVNIGSTQNTTSISVLNDGSNCQAGILRTSGPDDLFDVLSPDVAIFSASNGLSVPPGTAETDLPLNLTTDYIIRPDRPYVQIATTYENTSGSDLHLFVGDYINGSGQVEDFGPGLGFGQPMLRNGGTGSSSAPQGLDFLAYQGTADAAGVTYGVVFPRNAGATSDGTFDTGAFVESGVAAWLDRTNLVGTLLAPYNSKAPGPFLVPANGTHTFRRWFVVGTTVADVTAAHEDLFGHKTGIVQGTVTANGEPVAGAHVAFVLYPGNSCSAFGPKCRNVFSATITDEYGFYRAYLPPQTYNVYVQGPGMPYEGSSNKPAAHEVILKAKKTATVDVSLPATGGLRVVVQDQGGTPMAAKVSVVGFPQSPDPGTAESAAGLLNSFGRYFGYDPNEKGDDTFGLAKAFFADNSGDSGTVNLEPGSYHVVVSHGPEYDVYAEPITITAGATTTVNAVVHEVVDTTGFVSMDTHVHMINSPDSMITDKGRVISMLAEGVDFFPATDHDHVHDVSADIAALGASALVSTAPSDEITTFSYGHFNIWPLTVDPGLINGGALDWGRAGQTPGQGYPSNGSYDLLPSEVFASGNPATQVIQINHFNSGTLGHFNNLGIDTEMVPPESSGLVYRCVGGDRGTLPCQPQACLGGLGGNELAACAQNADCTGSGAVCNTVPFGRNCPGGGTCEASPDNLSAFIRMDPSVANLYDNGYTALELWIEATRAQTDLALGENLADWVGLLNQGIFKTATADSDTHHRVKVQAGSPRSFVAYPTDNPGSIDASTLAQEVNAGRVIGAGNLFMRVQLVGDGGAVASHALGDPLTVPATAGSGSVIIHVEAPTWAQFDRIEIYANSQPECRNAFTFFGVVNPVCDVSPLVTLNKGANFNVSTIVGVSGSGQRLVADKTVPLTITGDTWVIVVARGTDGVSKPLFPVNPADLRETGNISLAALTDNGAAPPWNLGEDGQLAMAFSNPLFFDYENDSLCHGGTPCP